MPKKKKEEDPDLDQNLNTNSEGEIEDRRRREEAERLFLEKRASWMKEGGMMMHGEMKWKRFQQVHQDSKSPLGLWKKTLGKWSPQEGGEREEGRKKRKKRGAFFGETLDQVLHDGKGMMYGSQGCFIPLLVGKCLEVLNVPENSTTKNVLAKHLWSNKVVNELRRLCEQDPQGSFINQYILEKEEIPKAHDIAGLLVCYLKSLPDPLWTRRLYPYFLQVEGMKDRQVKLKALQYLGCMLPKPNRDLLKVLLEFFARLDYQFISTLQSIGEAILMKKKYLSPMSRMKFFGKDKNKIPGLNMLSLMIEEHHLIFEIPSELLLLNGKHENPTGGMFAEQENALFVEREAEMNSQYESQQQNHRNQENSKNSTTLEEHSKESSTLKIQEMGLYTNTTTTNNNNNTNDEDASHANPRPMSNFSAFGMDDEHMILDVDTMNDEREQEQEILPKKLKDGEMDDTIFKRSGDRNEPPIFPSEKLKDGKNVDQPLILEDLTNDSDDSDDLDDSNASNASQDASSISTTDLDDLDRNLLKTLDDQDMNPVDSPKRVYNDAEITEEESKYIIVEAMMRLWKAANGDTHIFIQSIIDFVHELEQKELDILFERLLADETSYKKRDSEMMRSLSIHRNKIDQARDAVRQGSIELLDQAVQTGSHRSSLQYSNENLFSSGQAIPYKDLLRESIRMRLNRAQLEVYLSNEEFIQCLGCTREQFYDLPLWRRNIRKEKPTYFRLFSEIFNE